MLVLVGYFIVMPVAATAQVEVFEPSSVCFEYRCPIVSPHSNVAVERYSVRAQLDDQVATTRITQVLRNDNHWVAEGPAAIVNDPPAAAPVETGQTEGNEVPLVAWVIGGLLLTGAVIAWRQQGGHEHRGDLDSGDADAEKELAGV